MSADQSGCITPSPGGWGTRSAPSQSPNKDDHENFRARALLGSYSGSHSKCSIISDRVLKKPHVKHLNSKRGETPTHQRYCARNMRFKKVIKYWMKNAGCPKHHLMAIKGTGKGGQPYMTGVMRSVDRLADHACKLIGLEFIKLFWSWKELQSLSCYFQILMYFQDDVSLTRILKFYLTDNSFKGLQSVSSVTASQE